MKKTLFYFLLIVLFGCGGQQQSDTEKQEISKEKETQKLLAVETNDSTMIIRENHAVFLWPDTIEIKEWQEKYSESDYDEVIFDMTYYFGMAGELLDSLNISQIRCDKKFLVFVKSDKSEIKINRKETKGDMVFFNVDKEPIIAWAIDYRQDSVKSYFNLK